MGGRGHGSRTAIVRRALPDEVYDAVLHLLLGGEIAPGAALGIDALAGRLGVSPTPVREALVRLEATALVERSAMRGYRVAGPLEAAQLADLFEMRSLVEVAAARRAFERRELVTSALARAGARQAALAADLESLPAARSPERSAQVRRYVEAEWAFHRVIAHHSRNRYLEEAVGRFAIHPLRLHQLAAMDGWDCAATLAEHRAIATAFAEGTCEDVVAAVQQHLQLTRERSVL